MRGIQSDYSMYKFYAMYKDAHQIDFPKIAHLNFVFGGNIYYFFYMAVLKNKFDCGVYDCEKRISGILKEIINQ